MPDIFGRKNYKELGWNGLMNSVEPTSPYSPPAPAPSLVTDSALASASQAENVVSGSFADILFAKKTTFTDPIQGFRQGIDPTDKIFKWVIGSPFATIDFGVTTAGALTFNLPTAGSVSNAIFINDAGNNAYPAIDVRRSVGSGSGIFVQVESPSGHGLDVLDKSNTAAIHSVSTGSGAFVVPLQLENDTATSTNFYKVSNLRGGAAPAISVSQWVANNANPNGTLTGQKGDICQSSDGNIYVNKDGATSWSAGDWQLLGSTTLGSAAASISVSSFPARKYLRVLFHGLGTDAADSLYVRFNSDGGNHYDHKGLRSDGVSDAGQVNQPQALLENQASLTTVNRTITIDIANSSASYQKPFHVLSTQGDGLNRGATYWCNWTDTTNQITTVTIAGTQAKNLLTGSSLFIYGSST